MSKKLKIFITLFLILTIFPVMASDKKTQCATKHGRWDGVTCWCGAKTQSLENDAAICTKEDEKAQKSAEKEYLKDVDELIEAYKTVTNKIITKCRAEGGTATDEGCTK